MTDATLLQDSELAAGVFVTVGIAFLYLIYWLRRRRRALGAERLPTRAEIQDRAYNQISLARSAAERLERSGIDVSQPSRLLDSAEAARRRGDPDTALGMAKSAQATLLALREKGPGASSSPGAGPPGPAAMGMMPSGAPASVAGEPSSDPAPAAPRLPPNKAEARFQLSLLREEVERAQAAPTPTADLPEARRLAAASEAAFARGDFTEALRLGLRGRRAVGGRVEGLPPTRATRVAAPEDASAATSDPAVATSGSCSNCGQPLRANDRFCRGCGTSQGAPRCADCGEALAVDDRFCGACGAPIRA